VADFDREEQIRKLHADRKKKTQKKVEAAIKRLTKASKAINFNSVGKRLG
jgi:methylmalonyl-CoA mutase N-terminal domain/subunit